MANDDNKGVDYSSWSADQFTAELETTYNGLTIAGIVSSSEEGATFYKAIDTHKERDGILAPLMRPTWGDDKSLIDRITDNLSDGVTRAQVLRNDPSLCQALKARDLLDGAIPKTNNPLTSESAQHQIVMYRDE